MDFTKPSAMIDQLAALVSDPALHDRLVDAGKRRLQEFNRSDRIRAQEAIIEDYRSRRICWGQGR